MSPLLGCDAADAVEHDLGEIRTYDESSLPLVQDPENVASYGKDKIETSNSGTAYIDECRNLGVPVPDYVLEGYSGFKWVNHGEFDTLLQGEVNGELWTWESAEPDGVCMALPRWFGGESLKLGLICLGRTTSTTCFWDNPKGVKFPQGQAIPIGDFVGGADLKDNGGGQCSDCHAGENPFVVYPDDPAFESVTQTENIDIFPSAWPTPVVPDYPDKPWPGNLGPIEKLGPIGDGEQRCDTCHQKGGPGGRLPLLSKLLPRYCSDVIGAAFDSTMPPDDAGDFDIEDYGTHRAWLKTACESNVGEITPVTPPSTITLGPPLIEEPLYGCAERVAVTGARQGADVELHVGGQLIDTLEFRGVEIEFELPDPLVAGEDVKATQEFGGVVSDPYTAKVRDIYDDYPDGTLPTPTIAPAPLYACSTAIAVLNLPGVELIIKKQTSGGDEWFYRKTGVTHTWAAGLGDEFNPGDEITVWQHLCSANSYASYEEVVAAPGSIQAPSFDPPLLVAGQDFVTLDGIEQGFSVSVDEVGGAELWSSSSVPYNWLPGVEVGFTLGDQDELAAGQYGCPGGNEQSASMDVSSCNGSVLAGYLAIAQPQGGDDFVLVTEGIPSATVRVLANDGELGSGSGYVIGLNREMVPGELISVVQELKACSADSGYEIVVL